MRRRPSCAHVLAGAVCFAIALTIAGPGSAFEYDFGAGRGIQVHGFYEMQARAMSEGFRGDRWFASQFTHIFNLEVELDIAPDGIGFIDIVTGFVRAEARINCVFKEMCGFDPSYELYGDGADRQERNFTDGTTSGFSGTIPDPDGTERVHNGNGHLVTLEGIPPFGRLLELGANPDVIEEVTEPFADALFAVRKFDASNPRGPRILPQGPWQTGYNLKSVGALASVRNFTNPADPDLDDDDPRGGLFLRPRLPNLYVPSNNLVNRADDFDSFDQNFSENDMFLNYGASQDERELKEAYLDIETFDSRLWLRVGKQTIVWGKTELFRTTDQFNPQDIAITSLPSLEESRINLWSARAVWSFYDIGPFQDVRLEGAVLLDDFEPVDLGFCGEPYTVFLVCAKNFGLFIHGLTGTGLAGEERPENWWDSASGLEGGVRLEWRWNRFSFALTNFYGYNDGPYAEVFNLYERKVDPATGRPVDVVGNAYDTSGTGDPSITDIEYASLRNAAEATGDRDAARTFQGFLDSRNSLRDQSRDFNSGNRQLFDFVCGITVGIAGTIIDNPALEEACVLDLVNNVEDLGLLAGVELSAADALSMVLGGSGAGEAIASLLGGGEPVELVRLNQDPEDRNEGRFANRPACQNRFFRDLAAPSAACLDFYLTDEQEALLGCGPFFGTSCDIQGIDFFNAEFSVLGQRLPNIEQDAPVGTRVIFDEKGRRRTVVLPGARALENPDWDPRIDGCLRLDPALGGSQRINRKERFCTDPRNNNLFGLGYDSELEALSENFVTLLAALGATTDDDPKCGVKRPERCELVRAVVGLSGVQRPEVSNKRDGTFGRRDFLWHGGGEAVLKYNKRNVLGFSMDFAEDVTKTTWSFEFTWIDDERFASLKTERGNEAMDVFNLSVSMDRTTFINFLNSNRTFFFNSQWFFRYLEGWDDDRFTVDGPVTVLGTFTIATAYFQDRLAPAVTFIHDISSNSGGIITSFTYRYNEAFSISLGVSTYYGSPRRQAMPQYPLALGNMSPPYEQEIKYGGLSAIAERDELSLRLRYTF